MKRTSPDVIVIGGGNIGAATAFGLSKLGVAVALIDEGDMALRGARGNFGLVWFQGKGVGMPTYVDWCLEATRKWAGFAMELEERTGLSLDYCKPGGLEVCIDEPECATIEQELYALRRQTTAYPYECEFIDRQALQSMIPQMELGPAVLGATYCPHDGHVNPLALLRALHGAFQAAGGNYFPGSKVTDIRHDGRAIEIVPTERLGKRTHERCRSTALHGFTDTLGTDRIHRIRDIHRGCLHRGRRIEVGRRFGLQQIDVARQPVLRIVDVALEGLDRGSQ